MAARLALKINEPDVTRPASGQAPRAGSPPCGDTAGTPPPRCAMAAIREAEGKTI